MFPYSSYSVASDPSGTPNNNNRSLDLLVTLSTDDASDVTGIASRFLLRDLEAGRSLACRHQKSATFRAALDPKVPLVMVANGSGIAPFRYYTIKFL